MTLILKAVDVVGPHQWRWLLVDGGSGVALADHLVDLDPQAVETEAFEDLYRFLRWRAEPDRRVASEAELVARMGAWIGAAVLGEQIGGAMVAAAPVTVRVHIPVGADFLAFRPLELAHVDGIPLAARGDVALVYDLPGPAGVAKAPVGDALRMLAVFSLPTATSALALRRERYELSRLVRRVTATSRRRVELEVAQYGVTREKLSALAESGDGWDVLHLSGHGGAGQFLLERADGSADWVSTAELMGLLRPLRPRVKLAVVSACQSAAATTAETLRWLGLDDPAAELEYQAAQETGQASAVGLARALVAELGCAVVAMRYPVIDDFAVGFADALYDRVFRQVQRVDRAVAAAVRAAAGLAPSAARPALSVGTVAIFGTSAAGLSLVAPTEKSILNPVEWLMAGFPPELPRFVGRAQAMAAASAALAPASGSTAVLFCGMVGAGKTACALELAYRHQQAFAALAFWSAPTDPEQVGDALRLLAMALEAQLGDYRVAMVDKIATWARLENFLPWLRALLQDSGLLLVLDNLETLLTPAGQWRDPRWAPLIAALTGHDGESRVILTSRILPVGLDADAVLVQPVHALSRDESLLLARELPNLRGLLHSEAEPVRSLLRTVDPDPALGRRVLTLVQGHPQLLELADGVAANRSRLTSQLAAAEAAMNGAIDPSSPLKAFFAADTGDSSGVDILKALSAWTLKVAGSLPEPAQRLLRVLACVEAPDRSPWVIENVWRELWPGMATPLRENTHMLWAAGLANLWPTSPEQGSLALDSMYLMYPGVVGAIHRTADERFRGEIDNTLARLWTAVYSSAVAGEVENRTSSLSILNAGLAAAPYLKRLRRWSDLVFLLEQAADQDRSPVVAHQVAAHLHTAIDHEVDTRRRLTAEAVLASILAYVNPAEAVIGLQRGLDDALARDDYEIAVAVFAHLTTMLYRTGDLDAALDAASRSLAMTVTARLGPWTCAAAEGNRLRILAAMGESRPALDQATELLAHLDTLPPEPSLIEHVSLWNVREATLDIARSAALALENWQTALDLNRRIYQSAEQRGAALHDLASIRMNDHGPLLRLEQLDAAERILLECQQVFDESEDIGALSVVFSARADLEARRGRPQEAVALEHIALRYGYQRPEPGELAASHHNLAIYLERGGYRRDALPHLAAAALLYRITGRAANLAKTIRQLGSGREQPHVKGLDEVLSRTETVPGVRLSEVLDRLAPDRTKQTAMLTEIVEAARTVHLESLTGDLQQPGAPTTSELR